MVRIVMLLVLGLSFLRVNGTENDTIILHQAEIQLNTLSSGIPGIHTDEAKLALADSINSVLYEILIIPASFDYPFDHLKIMGKIMSPDKKVRFYTWNLPLEDGTNRYYGFLQRKTDRNAIRVFQLTDKSADIAEPAMAELPANKWYGCLVYDIIENSQAPDIYTFLGYDPDNPLLSKKIVDILWFNGMGEPVFGKEIFHFKNRFQYRIIFEYSSKAQMSLTWNKKAEMIVFDHLSPSKPGYTGNFQYYGPDFSYDALKYKNGTWELIEDIDMRNP
jgi:hypothetical protein